MKTLEHVWLLEDLPGEVKERIVDACTWREFDAHAQIIDRQSETQDVFFVVSGAVRVSIYSLAGREITLDDVTTGGHFGELAAIDGNPRSASVTALQPSRVASLSQRQFIQLLEENPALALKTLRSLSSMIRASTNRILDLSTLAANNRVHAEILRLSKLNMTGDSRAEISPIPVHGDIASRVSTTRETVARVLSDLARQNLIERQKDRLVVQDVDVLEEMVEDVRGE